MAERDEDLVREQEEAAAAEAGGIGGRAPDDVDEAERPLAESGEGESEGFELAEEQLIDHAEHTAGEGAPRLTQMGEEAEIDPSVQGEADTERPAD